MGASEQTGGAMTVSNNGVTVEKELVEDEFPIPTIRFLIVNERDDPVSITLAETVPEDFTIASLGFHPDYGSENWTCLDDEKAEFVRDVPAGEEIETLYGIRIDDVDRASSFMTEPTLEAVQPSVEDAESEEATDEEAADAEQGDDEDQTPDDSESSAEDEADRSPADANEEPVTLSLNEEDIETSDTDGTEPPAGDNGEYGPSVAEGDLPEGDIDLSGVEAPNNDSLHVDAILGEDDPDIEVAVPTEPSDAGPEEGALVDRLVEELQRAEIDADQKEILREQLDLGVPSETRARLERLQDRIETLSAYTDSLEAFLDEDGTAQELLGDFETQVTALREDVATIRHHTRANAADVATLDGDIADLEAHVETVEDRLDSVADHAADIEDELAETDDHLEDVEADLEGATARITENEDDIAALDDHLAEVDDDLTAVEERVTETEADVDRLDADLDAVEERVSETETDLADAEARIEDTEADVEALEEETTTLETDLHAVDRRVTATEADAIAHHDRLAALEDGVEELDAVADDHDDRLADLDAETDEIREEIEAELAGVKEELDEETDAIRADLDSETEALRETLETETDDVRADLEEESEELRGEIDDVEDDLEDLLTWRDELGEMFQ